MANSCGTRFVCSSPCIWGHAGRLVIAISHLVVALAVVGCRDRESPLARSVNVPNHRLGTREVITSLDTVFSTSVGARDSALLNPVYIDASSAGIWLYDGADNSIVLLSLGGRFQWQTGRRGAGPGEFSNVRDIAATSDARLLVLDAVTDRVTVIGAAGQVLQLISLGEVEHAEQVAVLERGEVLLGLVSAESPFVRLDSTGTVRDTIRFPWPPFSGLPPLASQSFIASDEVSNRWSGVLALGSVFSAFRGTSVEVSSASLINWHEPPVPSVHAEADGSIVTQLPNALVVYDADADSSVLSVLVHGASTRSRFVDRYSLATGSYLNSIAIPFRATSFAVHAGTYYFIVDRLFPQIVAVRPVRAP